MEQFRSLAATELPVVVDAYDPMHLEMLEQGKGASRADWERLVRSRVALLNHQLLRADLVLCASERQRSLYLGQLGALGRINPATYVNDTSLSRLLAVAPFGIEATPPAAAPPALRGAVPPVDSGTRLLVWGGGLYNWFDPLLLIRAVHALWQRRPSVVLVFLGTKSPGVEPMGIVKEAMDLAEELGAVGRSVVFNEGWVPYERRGAYFVEADAGVSTHHVHVETEFSFRTRILDYLWAGLPMVVTEGDGFADLVRSEALGIAVEAGDQDALEAALEKVLFDEEAKAAFRSNVARVRELFIWERTLAPLRDFVAAPVHAADVIAAGSRRKVVRRAGSLLHVHDRPSLWRDLRLAVRALRRGGVGELRARIALRRERLQ